MSSSPRLRRILASAFAGALLASTAVPSAWAEPPESEAELLIERKVEPEILETIDEHGETEAWLRFTGAPDWNDALTADDRQERGEAAVEAALDHADQSQADVVDVLESAGAEYETFWASATVKVVADAELLATIVAFEEVEAVVEAPEYGSIEPVTPEGGDRRESRAEPFATQQEGAAWHLEDVRAPELWAEGIDGEGIVVASIDTGVQYDHPALVEQYRGNNGDGTFTHDYNFFDPTGLCEGEPCDISEHGTHVTGTMVGDDGEGNRIGVAPGAKWIAVSAGVEPVLESFLAAGEWIAAPTDRHGGDPDPAMAPHVVNNSWSWSNGYDPFYADIVELWHAAGIVPVFSAGNDGEDGCLTVNSPGLYENVITVGATDINGEITPWSSKGPGMDGLVKPDVAAPGDDIVSSIPGNEYGEMSGTSMAAPHVAGAVALMMAASPELEGNYEGVYEHLTRNAVAVEDTSCSGSPEFNNIYGHGHIDVYAAAHDAPAGAFGSLTGTVTDTDGAPIAVAHLRFAGPVDRFLLTDAAGGYAFERLPAGTYGVTVSRFFYDTVTGTVEIKQDGTAVFDAELSAASPRTVTGAVVDGSGQGWPLAATVATAQGEAVAHTDPLTGEFSIVVPEEGDWPLFVTSRFGGYETAMVDSDDAALIELVTTENCNVPGYGSVVLHEDFDDSVPPAGWEVVNDGDGPPWEFEHPAWIENGTPGSGGFAQAGSSNTEPESLVDTAMITAPMDLSATGDPTLRFASFFMDLGIGAEAAVAISVDGGATWERVWWPEDDLYAALETVDLSPWAEATSAQLKFHYTDHGEWAYYWQVDDVFIGCDPLEGGLVTGVLLDGDGEPVAGGLVHDAATGAEARTDDDGRYVLFTDAGPTTLTASSANHDDVDLDVEVESGAVTGADIVFGID